MHLPSFISTAQSSGWIWDIGLPTRRGVGHVYSSSHISDDAAEQELRGYLGPRGRDLAVRKLAIRAGHRCRHNEHYWLARPWAALGVAAHGWEPDGTRTVNLRDVDAYLSAVDGCASRESPHPEVLATELIGTGIRHVDGLDRALLRARTGLDVAPDGPAAAALQPDPGRLRLRAEAFPLADAVAARLSASLQPAPSPPS